MTTEQIVIKLDDPLVQNGQEALLKCEPIPLSSPLFAEARRREELRQARLAGEPVEEEPEGNEPLLAFPEIAWRGPFKTYREAMQGTTEASDVHLFAYGVIASHFRPGRHRWQVPAYRQQMAHRFQTWRTVTGRASQSAEAEPSLPRRRGLHSITTS
jgi:hypothetical protein